MAEDLGLNVKVGLDGSGFTTGIGKVQEQLAYAKAQFREASSALGNFGTSLDQLKLKAQYLTAQIDIQEGSVSALQAQYDEAVVSTDADEAATQRLATRLLNAQAVLNNMRNSLAETATAMEELGTASEESTAVVEESTAAIDLSAGSMLETLAPMAAMFGLYEGGKEIVKAGVEETNQYNAAQAQLANQLKTTKNAIGMTSEQLDSLAESTGENTAITSAMNLTAESTLLNYNQISKQTLPQATQAVDDLATKIAISKGQSVPSLEEISQAAKMVGKAMEDPTKGTTAFSKAMVSFSPAQILAIKNLQKHGETAKAAALLMKDLSSETAGASTTAATTYAGKVAVLKKQMDEFAGQAVTKAEHALTSLGETGMNFINYLEKHKTLLSFIEAGVAGITGAFLAYKTIQIASTIATNVMTAAQWLLNAAVDANPIGLIILAIGALIAITVLVATHWKTVSGVLSGVWKDIKEGFRDFVDFLIDGINELIKLELLPFNFIIQGLDKIPGVKIPELKLAIPDLPKFDVGTNYVPNDMVAMIHKGEMIVPKAQNPYANSPSRNNQNSQPSIINITHYTVLDGKVIQKSISQQQYKADKNRGRALGVLA